MSRHSTLVPPTDYKRDKLVQARVPIDMREAFDRYANCYGLTRRELALVSLAELFQAKQESVHALMVRYADVLSDDMCLGHGLIQFRAPPETRRDLRVFAAQHDITLREAVMLSLLGGILGR